MAYKRVHTSAQQLQTAERRAFVLAMRKSGATYDQIANAAIEQFGTDHLPSGWDKRYAYRDVQAELTSLRTDTAENAEAIRQIEVERLDALLAALWGQARGKRTKDEYIPPDLQALDRVLKIMERRAKLVGLDKTPSDGEDREVVIRVVYGAKEMLQEGGDNA